MRAAHMRAAAAVKYVASALQLRRVHSGKGEEVDFHKKFTSVLRYMHRKNI